MPRRGLCPSARCEEDALLLGVVSAAGQVEFLPQLARVSRAFVEIAQAGRQPESRFRFAAPCQQAGCRNWGDGGCALPRRIASDLANAGRQISDQPLRPCAIRRACVWFAQEGPAACPGCELVVTDVAPQECQQP